MSKLGFNVNFQGRVVPSQYLEAFKSAVSFINVSEHFYNSATNYISKVKITPKAVRVVGLFTPKVIDVQAEIKRLSAIVIEASKEITSIIEQVHFKKAGKSDINNMQYTLISSVDSFYYLSISQQNEVIELINKLTKENNDVK